MIREYKRTDNPGEFKKKHYKDFKEWDKATHDMRTLKKEYGIQSKKDLEDCHRTLKNGRADAYQLYSNFDQPENITKEKVKEKEIERGENDESKLY